MIERTRRSGLLMAMLAMGAMGMSPSGKSSGTHYTPPKPTDEQKRRIALDSKNLGQLHRFVIKGKEIYARNKKDALRQVNGK